jgi:hypothetical protein
LRKTGESEDWLRQAGPQVLSNSHDFSRIRRATKGYASEADNPRHPGDDGKAREIVERCRELSLLPYPTEELSGLIAALSLCDLVVCCDGGAMHLAAGLGKPILCLFGDASSEQWRPWKVPHELLRPPSRDMKDVSVEQALAGFERLRRELPVPSEANLR